MSTLERISTAVLELLAERGATGLTMSEIASRAEVARQTLYNHFPDVESAVFAATSAHQTESFEHLQSILETIATATGRIEQLVRHTAALGASGHPSPRALFSGPVAELAEKHDRAFRTLVSRTLMLGVDTGEFRSDLDPEADALLVQRMIEAVAELHREEATDGVDRAVRTVLAALHA